MYLYHYFEKGRTPFLTLSDLSDEEAIKIHNSLEEEGNIFAKRNSDGKYMYYRRIIEKWLYSTFVQKGGKPERQTPYYMILGECDRCKSWFKNGDFIKIPLDEFDKDTLSFTYGDSFPTFDPSHGQKQEYRRNVYTYDEIWDIIKKYGMPQDVVKWTDDTPYWVPAYVEVQVWSDKTINRYKQIQIIACFDDLSL